MKTERTENAPMRALFEPEEVREVLRETFYRSDTPVAAGADVAPSPPKGMRSRGRRRPKPDHYEVICISMYKEDLARLDERVAELKASGHRKISRSALIRFALATMDVDELPRPL